MKIIRLLLFSLFTLLSSLLASQDACQTQALGGSLPYNGAICAATCNNTAYSDPITLKIYFHVARFEDGSGGHSETEVDLFYAKLDEDFADHNISFAWDGCINYVEDDCRLEATPNCPFNHNAYFQDPDIYHTDGIDIILVKDFPLGFGVANGIGDFSEFILMAPNPSSWGAENVIAHEMGHVLNLFHTHHGCETGSFDDPTPPAGSTLCCDAGDFVCDTPPDPLLFGEVQNCQWTGVAGTSIWNGLPCPVPHPIGEYNPDVENIMSYAPENCQDYFSDGQGARMRESIMTIPSLSSCIVSSGNPMASTCCGSLTITNGTTTQLASMLGLNNPSELFTADRDILVVGNLTVDDYTLIGPKLNFYMTGGSTITVQSGVFMQKVGGFIKGCNGQKMHTVLVAGTVSIIDVDISDGVAGVWFAGGTGEVHTSRISNVDLGVVVDIGSSAAVQVCDIDASLQGVIAQNGSSVAVTQSNIGLNEMPQEGIVVHNNSDGLIYDNEIETTHTGIEFTYSSGAIEGNIVNINGAFAFPIGIYSFGESVLISDNDISGGGYEAIGAYAGNGSLVFANRVNDDYAYAIDVVGGRSNSVRENTINGDSYVGINNLNSQETDFDCNYIESAGSFGMLNGWNCFDADFRTNQFIDADVDLLSQSEVGDEYLHGNCQWDNVITQVPPGLNNYFWVTDKTDNDCETPVSINDPDWFQEDMGQFLTCTPTFSGGGPTVEFLCWWIDYVTSLQNNPKKYNLYFNYTMWIINHYKFKVPQEDWPLCLVLFMQSVNDPTINELARMKYELDEVLASSSAELLELGREQIAFSNSIPGQFDDGILEQRKTIKEGNALVLDQLVAQQKQELGSLEANNSTAQIWTAVYGDILDYLSDNLTEEDLPELTSVANLCPKDYGDVVHWASGLVSAISYEVIPFDNTCDAVELRESKHSVVENLVKVYPNPASSVVVIENSGVNARLDLVRTTGEIAIQGNLNKGQNTIDVSAVPSGIYLLSVTWEDGETISEKLIITR